jgi:hypothetical protein
VQLVALIVDQVSVEELPDVIEVGVAVKVKVGADVPDPIVTIVWAVVEPEALVAVKIYVVVTVGDTTFVPEVATVPTALLMLTEVALEVDHVRVEELPEVIEAGEADRLAVGKAEVDALTVTVALLVVEVPEALVEVRV